MNCARCDRPLEGHKPFLAPDHNPGACCGFVFPTPGSNSAIAQGCTCAVIDNHHGQGFPWGAGENKFWISGNCPLHARALPKEDVNVLLWVKFRRWWVYGPWFTMLSVKYTLRGWWLTFTGRCQFCAKTFSVDRTCYHCVYDTRTCHHCNKNLIHATNYGMGPRKVFGQNLDKIARGEMVTSDE